MSEHIFDVVTRHAFTAGSRRGYFRALVGLVFTGSLYSVIPNADIEAKKGRKRRRRNKKRRDQNGNRPLTCAPRCTGKVCGGDSCGGSCGSCSAGELCAGGLCVIGQGTCQNGDDVCDSFEHTCGTNGCHCRTSTSNQTRCGQEHEIDDTACDSDAECAERHGGVPGAFCAQAVGVNCPGEVRLCYAPCNG